MSDGSTSWLARLKQYSLVALGFIHIGFGRGLHGTFGVFFVAMLDAFGWSRAVTAGALSLSIMVEGVFHPVVGTLTDKLGGRKTLILGGLVLAVGLALSATIDSVWSFYFWVGIVSAAGISLIGMVPHVAIISRHYASRKATALGIAWSGGGVGIFLLVPATAALVSTWGWRWAYVGLALLVVVIVIPPVFCLIPSDYEAPKSDFGGLHGSSHGKHGGGGGDGDWTVKRALTNSSFWLLFTARVLASLGNQVIVTHQVAHAVDVGYPKVFAASIFGIMGVVSIAGRLGFGYLADVMRREVVYTWVQVVSAVGTVALMATTDTSTPALLYIYAVFYGLGQGSRALVLSAISIDVFKGKNFGAIFGYFTLSVGVGGAIGAWLGGYLFDVTRSYMVAFSISLSCLILSIFVVWMSTRNIRRQNYTEGMRA